MSLSAAVMLIAPWLAAQAPRHWAFQPVAPPAVPAAGGEWARHPIDAFLAEKRRGQGLHPASEASALVLLRRAYLDLVGVAPPPEDVERFARDRRPDAFARLVDRLLESPQYGERWGRHWLDVVRYADTAGFEQDLQYEDAWKYRDYVIRSFNEDKPFDRFMGEQVAGDEIEPGSEAAVTATAMYCLGPAVPEAAMMSTQLEYDWLTDAADTTGAAFLGLTFGCARCHSHKSDPISQTDYFALQAIFAASDRPYPDKYRTLRIKGLNGFLADAPIPGQLLDDPRCTLKTQGKTGLRLFHRDRPLETRRLQRGELSKPREIVPPALPQALNGGRRLDLSSLPPTELRSALARWLSSPENPLTARVLVNRVWAWHFGEGLVRTPNDFGVQGEPPTHPELLDWLARDLTDHGWTLKRLHRLIMSSRTYRMQSAATEEGMRLDPENRLYGRFPRRRLDAESVRDQMLASAGTLNPKPFGPPVVPPLDGEELTGLFGSTSKWAPSPDAAEHSRRSVYLLARRTFIYPMLSAFNPPDLMNSCPRRTATTVPTQALTLLNSPVARTQAAAFARDLMRDREAGRSRLVARAFLRAFARPATPAESERSVHFLREREAALRAAAGWRAREEALTNLCLALFNTNEFIHVD